MIIKFCKWRETRSTSVWDRTRAVQEVERVTTQIGYERDREAGLQERECYKRDKAYKYAITLSLMAFSLLQSSFFSTKGTRERGLQERLIGLWERRGMRERKRERL